MSGRGETHPVIVDFDRDKERGDRGRVIVDLGRDELLQQRKRDTERPYEERMKEEKQRL